MYQYFRTTIFLHQSSYLLLTILSENHLCWCIVIKVFHLLELFLFVKH